MKRTISGKKKLFNIYEIWHYKELLFFLSFRDIKLRYKHILIALFWALLPSLAMSVILTISFSEVLTPTLNMSYFLFAFSGLMFWNYFFSAVNRVSTSLLVNRSFITKISFPKIIIPVSSIVVSLFDCLLGSFCFLLLLIYFNVPITISGVFLLYFGILLTTIFALGVGIFFSVLNIFYKDIRELLPLVTSFLFFLTPVIYPTKTVLKPYNQFLYLNPLTGIIESVREVFFLQSDIVIEGMFIAIICSMSILCISILFFLHKEHEITDVL